MFRELRVPATDAVGGGAADEVGAGGLDGRLGHVGSEVIEEREHEDLADLGREARVGPPDVEGGVGDALQGRSIEPAAASPPVSEFRVPSGPSDRRELRVPIL